MSSCYRSTNSFKYKVDLNKINPGGLQRSPSAKDTDLKIRADFQRCCPPTTRSAGFKLIWDFQQIHLWYQVENLRWPPPWVITFTRLYKSLIPDLDAETQICLRSLEEHLWHELPNPTSPHSWCITSGQSVVLAVLKWRRQKTECLLWTLTRSLPGFPNWPFRQLFTSW